MSYLTVEETLKFAAFLRLPASYRTLSYLCTTAMINYCAAARDVKEDRVEAVMQLLGLENARSTPVGDEFLRGISGGEKRRVTIATEWVKGSRVLFLGARGVSFAWN